MDASWYMSWFESNIFTKVHHFSPSVIIGEEKSKKRCSFFSNEYIYAWLLGDFFSCYVSIFLILKIYWLWIPIRGAQSAIGSLHEVAPAERTNLIGSSAHRRSFACQRQTINLLPKEDERSNEADTIFSVSVQMKTVLRLKFCLKIVFISVDEFTTMCQQKVNILFLRH